jgi:hypothetical protein
MVMIPSNRPMGYPGIHVTGDGPDAPPIDIVNSVVKVVKTTLPSPHPACNKADIRKIAKRCEDEHRRQQAAAASHNVPKPVYTSIPANGKSHIQALAQSRDDERRRQEAIADYNRRKAAWDDYQRQLAYQRQLTAYNTPAPMQHYDPPPVQQYYYDPTPAQQYYYDPGYGYGGYEPMDHGSDFNVGGLIDGIGGLIEGFGGMDHDYGD